MFVDVWTTWLNWGPKVNPAQVKEATDWWADRMEKKEHRERFRAALYDILSKSRFGKQAHEDIAIQCEYDPDKVLLKALKKAGIECSGSWFSAMCLLPEKTVMWLNRNGAVTVKHGYRTSTVSIRKPSLN